MSSRNLPVVTEDRASPEVRALYAEFRERFGRPTVPGILECFATHPPLLKSMMMLAETVLFTDGALGRQVKEMIATSISAANRCAYCADSHGFALRAQGASDDLIAAMMDGHPDSAELTLAQRALLDFAARVNQSSESITAAHVEALRGHGWSDLEIAEAIHIAALFATFNRVVNAFGVQSQELLASAGGKA